MPAVAGAVMLAAAALAAPLQARSGPAAKPAAVPTSVGITVVRTSQRSILKTGRIKVLVQSVESGDVTLVPRSRLAEPGSASVRIGRRGRAVFKRPGSARLSVRLSRAGRALVSQCRPRTLLVSGTLTPSRRASGPVAGRDRGFGSAPMRLDRSRCPGAPGGGAPGGGGSNGGGSGSNGGGSGSNGGETAGGPLDGNVIPPRTPYTGDPIDTSNASRCDWLDASSESGDDPVCLEPWPNDYFTVADPTSDTGRRVNLNQASMPANKLGIHINPAENNRNDGFSPGSMIIARVPGLDNPQAFENTGAVGVDDMASYADPNQPVVVINADTGERQPIWSEIDYNPIDPAKGGDAASAEDRQNVNLIIRPAVNLDEGGHYIVALRDLKDENGDTIQPTDAFRVYRDNLTTDDPAIENRRPQMEDLFEDLGKAGISRSNLYLTWDFTVASERNLSERMLSIRDDAFAQLGDTDLADGSIAGTESPSFSINPLQTENFTAAENANIARIVHGTVTVPCYMDTPGCLPDGSTFNYSPADALNPDRLPTRATGNTAAVGFECIIPHSALDASGHSPARVSLYGHGLLGSASEVEGGNVEAMANEHNIIFCATDWYGFATTNIPNVLLILQDVSLFPLLADETQQGMLNFLYLGRLGIHPDGLTTDAAFHDSGGDPVINNDRLLYDGNSQGGILGGALTAVAPDFTRAVLGVPAMNYSTLLERSVDFEPYAEGIFTPQVCDELPDPLKAVCNAAPSDSPLGLYDNYPNELDRPLIFALMQMLWDRAEPDGYAQHITDDPLPNTPPHTVLMQAAFGDHQVANVAAEVEARTIGASVYSPAFDPGRYWDPNGVFGLSSVPSFPFGGSALVYWDGGPVVLPDNPNGGTATPPNEDIPPRPTSGCGQSGPPGCGSDPHSYPRNDVKARAQKSDFLQLEQLNNYCTTDNRPDKASTDLRPNTGTAIPCHSHGWVP